VLNLGYAYRCSHCGAEYFYYDTEFREPFTHVCGRCEKSFEVDESNLTFGFSIKG